MVSEHSLILCWSTVTPRAPALPALERRQALVEATTPLLRCHGLAVSTKQIAAAAGVAEGTIFRVFESKDELLDACLRDAFDPVPLLVGLQVVDRDQPLRARAIAVTALVQRRFTEVFELMIAMGFTSPPDHLHDPDEGTNRSWQARTLAVIEELLADPRGELRVSPGEFARYLRLLTFSGSHPLISQHQPLTPEEIVDTILFGLSAEPRREP